MTIIELSALPNGAHRNQTGESLPVPDGWAEIPAGMVIPDTFPFVSVTADADGNITALTAGTVPAQEPVEPVETDADRITALEKQLAATQDALDAMLMG